MATSLRSCARAVLAGSTRAGQRHALFTRNWASPACFISWSSSGDSVPVRRLAPSTSRATATRAACSRDDVIVVENCEFRRDKVTNVTPCVLSHVGRNLHLTPHHPLCLMKQRITDFIYSKYVNRSGNPLFSVFDRLSPVVTTEQNFDSLLVPQDHVSRDPKESYYLDAKHLLRPHTSAHQRDLILSGLDRFLVVGDVYRRDDIDATHYPVFHQIEGVRLYTRHELFRNQKDADSLHIFEEGGERTPEKQACHTLEASKLAAFELKKSLEDLTKHVFGSDIAFRWVDAYFPFTHPSFELEVNFKGKWLEVVGCGVMEQGILDKGGASDKIGWAYGIGLERLAMVLYDIPDIRLFWSRDTGFLNQFKDKGPRDSVTYKPISKYPQCINDISFWIPDDGSFSPKDFYDVVRTVGGDIVEQVELVDTFVHPKKRRTSHCFRIVYRHMERTLVQAEVNEVHKRIEEEAAKLLNVEIR